MSYLETIGTKELMLLANDILRDYNKCREEFFNMARRYFNQAATNGYVKEDDMVVKLDRCKELKRRYCELCKILADRKIKPIVGGFSPESIPSLDSEEVLHLV